MAWVTPRTWATGNALNATNLNTIRDSLRVVGEAWATYTPSLTASTTNPTLGSSSIIGRYRQLGIAGTSGTIDIDIRLTIGSGWSAGSGNYQFGLPSGITPLATAASTWRGGGMARDVSVPAAKSLTVYHFSTTTVGAVVNETGVVVAPGAPYTWATGDIISLGIRAMEIT